MKIMNTLRNIIRFFFPLANSACSLSLLTNRIKDFKVKTADLSKANYAFEILTILFLILNICFFLKLFLEMFIEERDETFIYKIFVY